MGKLRIISLSESEKEALSNGYKTGANHVFRMRCHIILMKSEGFFSREISAIPGYPPELCVNKWLTRYEKLGIEGLKTQPGRGRKNILDPLSDGEIVRAIVQEERQRLTHAKALIEEKLNKKINLQTLYRFLKKTDAATNVSKNK